MSRNRETTKAAHVRRDFNTRNRGAALGRSRAALARIETRRMRRDWTYEPRPVRSVAFSTL